MTHLDFQVALVEGLITRYEKPRTRAGCSSLVADGARLTARHFIGYIPENKRRKCEVYTQDKFVDLLDLKVPILERGVVIVVWVYA